MMAEMKYTRIKMFVLFQKRYIQEADTNLPNSNALPINPTATGAPGKIAIKPAMENQAATELMNSAEKRVSSIILNVFCELYT
jgi:hypothetical protein